MPSGHRPQPPVGTARVAIQGLGGAGNPWVNVFWLQLVASSHVAADLQAVIDSFIGNYNTQFSPMMSSAFSMQSAKASWLYAAGQSIETLRPGVHPGTASASFQTDAVCAVIDWSIADFYRGGHPRSYFPGVYTAALANGRALTSTYQTNLGTAANAFITGVNGITHGAITQVTLGTVRFASNNAWLSPPVFRPYQGASIRPVLGSQRRRYAAG